MIARTECAARDAADPLGPLRNQFALEATDRAALIYLDGNSLGVLPHSVAGHLQQIVRQEWGENLIRSRNTAGWMARAGSQRPRDNDMISDAPS